MPRGSIVVVLAALGGVACTRDPTTHADNLVVADDASTDAPLVHTTATSISASASASASVAASASAGPRPLTMDEVADRCGHKGNLVCCLGPPIAGPPPKPYCYPAQ